MLGRYPQSSVCSLEATPEKRHGISFDSTAADSVASSSGRRENDPVVAQLARDFQSVASEVDIVRREMRTNTSFAASVVANPSPSVLEVARSEARREARLAVDVLERRFAGELDKSNREIRHECQRLREELTQRGQAVAEQCEQGVSELRNHLDAVAKETTTAVRSWTAQATRIDTQDAQRKKQLEQVVPKAVEKVSKSLAECREQLEQSLADSLGEMKTSLRSASEREARISRSLDEVRHQLASSSHSHAAKIDGWHSLDNGLHSRVEKTDATANMTKGLLEEQRRKLAELEDAVQSLQGQTQRDRECVNVELSRVLEAHREATIEQAVAKAVSEAASEAAAALAPESRKLVEQSERDAKMFDGKWKQMEDKVRQVSQKNEQCERMLAEVTDHSKALVRKFDTWAAEEQESQESLFTQSMEDVLQKIEDLHAQVEQHKYDATHKEIAGATQSASLENKLQQQISQQVRQVHEQIQSNSEKHQTLLEQHKDQHQTLLQQHKDQLQEQTRVGHEQHMTRLEDLRQQLGAHHDEQQQKHVRLQQHLAHQFQRHSQASQEHFKKLEKHEQLHTEAGDQKRQLEVAHRENADKSQQLITSVTVQLEAHHQRHESHVQIMQTLQQRLDAHGEQVDDARQDISNCEQQVHDARQNLSSSKQHADSLQENLDSVVQQVQQLERSQEQKGHELTKQLQSHTVNLVKAQEHQSQQGSAALKAQHDETTARFTFVESVQVEMSRHTEAHDNLCNLVEQLRADLELEQARSADLEQARSANSQVVPDFCQAFQCQLKGFSEIIDEQQPRLRDLANRVDAQNDVCRDLAETVCGYDRQISDMDRSWKRHLEESESRIGKLEETPGPMIRALEGQMYDRITEEVLNAVTRLDTSTDQQEMRDKVSKIVDVLNTDIVACSAGSLSRSRSSSKVEAKIAEQQVGWSRSSSKVEAEIAEEQVHRHFRHSVAQDLYVRNPAALSYPTSDRSLASKRCPGASGIALRSSGSRRTQSSGNLF